ncbi:peptide deformylase, mitochondrial [Bombus fervidus]|uniref:peptide deformylase, mitochondrial n=1 Tax=Bombus fervidus TaxID=203811 RepID=UPI003AB273EA
MFKYSNLISRCVKNVQKSNLRSFSFRSIKKLISIYFRETAETAKPPYDHICQVGNPVLRQKASPVDIKKIHTVEFQKVLDHLYKMLKKSDTVGLAAPQIGLSWQIFAIEITESYVKDIHPTIRSQCQIDPIPLTYFINPEMKIINSEELIFYETCGSLKHFQAEVPRPKEIQIKALDRFGKPFCWEADGWLARIAHHEMDHLKGLIYTDRMFPLTFDYIDWDKENCTNVKKDIVS